MRRKIANLKATASHTPAKESTDATRSHHQERRRVETEEHDGNLELTGFNRTATPCIYANMNIGMAPGQGSRWLIGCPGFSILFVIYLSVNEEPVL